MITVLSFGGHWGLASISPFCQKVECYLRLTNTPHTVKPGNPQQSPHGKLPVVKLEDGTVIADSSAIISTLEGRSQAPLDAHLTSEQRGVALAVQRLAEEHLYFGILYQRWKTPEGWAMYGPVISGLLPRPLGVVLAPILRRQVIRYLHGQGLGRLTLPELDARLLRDIAAIEGILGDSDYLLGDRPTTVDCSVWAMLHSTAVSPAPGAMRARILGSPALVAYLNRIAEAVDQPRVELA